jgi:conjugative transfer pilus assembly protein TraH
VAQDLNDFFNDLGADSANVTDPHAYQGQRAGYYSGGSVTARNQVRNTQVAQIDLPDYSAGCGGIDLHSGSLSFVREDEIKQTMKSILNNAAAYTFKLGLKTLSPQIESTMTDVKKAADAMNRMNINSCETAVDMVGGLWPKTKASQQQVCQDLGTQNDHFTDWAKARQGCGQQGKIGDVFDEMRDDSPYANMVFHEGNIAWRAMKRHPFLSQNPEVAELFMSLSGTITLDQSGDHPQMGIHPSLAGNQGLLKALLHGGTTRIYHCAHNDYDQCKQVTASELHVSDNQALASRVDHLLNGMVSKIQQDRPLNAEEKGLLNMTQLPVYKMLNVQTAWRHGQGMDVTQYADFIATDLVYQYLREALETVSRTASTLQLPSDQMEQFEDGIRQARETLQNQQHATYEHLATTLQLIQRTQMIEKQLNSQLSGQMARSLNWARGLHGVNNH